MKDAQFFRAQAGEQAATTLKNAARTHLNAAKSVYLAEQIDIRMTHLLHAAETVASARDAVNTAQEFFSGFVSPDGKVIE